jgi:hypothetical protein
VLRILLSQTLNFNYISKKLLIMEQEKALKVLLEVALVAQAKGILSLDDAVVVKEAFDVIVKTLPQEEPVVEEAVVADDVQEN